ncbi:glycosyltransferase [Croceivirga thetidis]|uniref:Glycosyltransferase n=1 Tax=Croceivirga thetidis TaxID=2721623 RepID=A0ABX1GQ28_9FLAO|nr:glycosyltransferase [Croceivirga thetidis]NKI32017.1 glycosyltransferase [Croceivirga thetidis]
MGKKVYFFTNLAPHYRQLLWLNILKNQENEYSFLCGKETSSGIKQIDFETEDFEPYRNRIEFLKNRYLKKKYLIWQSGAITKALSSKLDVAIITGDAWVITNWIISIILKLRGKKVVFWSHGIYGNEKGLKKFLRILFYRLAHAHLLYERRAKTLMSELGFNKHKLNVIFNSLDYEKSLSLRSKIELIDKKSALPFFSDAEKPTLLFIGRLTAIKKLDLLMNAYNQLLEKGFGLNLLIVGDGPMQNQLSTLVEPSIQNKSCHFYGPCYSEEKLAELISASDLCISPGNVGLTAVHCLSYGTPVLTHDNFYNQMPEAGAINPGKSGLLFKENSVESIVEKVEYWIFEQKLSREEIRKNCYKIIDDYYNPQYQIKVVNNLVNGNNPLL